MNVASKQSTVPLFRNSTTHSTLQATTSAINSVCACTEHTYRHLSVHRGYITFSKINSTTEFFSFYQLSNSVWQWMHAFSRREKERKLIFTIRVASAFFTGRVGNKIAIKLFLPGSRSTHPPHRWPSLYKLYSDEIDISIIGSVRTWMRTNRISCYRT